MRKFYTVQALVLYLAVAALGNKTETDRKNVRIVIIGAGISGLSAANQLINIYGFKDVKILEGLDRMGGRIHSTVYENGVLEMGAEWIHGEANPVYQLAVELGALSNQGYEDEHGEQYYTQNGCQILEPLKSQLETMMRNITDQAEEVADETTSPVSLGQLFESLYHNYTSSNVSYDKLKLTEIENGASDWYRMSVRQYSEWNKTVGNPDVPLGVWGYKPIVDYFLLNIPSEIFRLNTTVIKIAYKTDENVIKIDTNNDETFIADHVIVTSSIGYLKENAKNMFQPSLSEEKLKTIQALGYDTVGKVFLIYDQPFWTKNATSLNFLRAENDTSKCNTEFIPKEETKLSKIFFYIAPKPFFDNILCAFIDGADAELMESSSEMEISEAVTIALQRFINNASIPKPKRVINYNSVECHKINCQRKTLQEPVIATIDGRQNPIILFAGEATSEHEFQTTHGAMESGRREAKRLSDFYITTSETKDIYSTTAETKFLYNNETTTPKNHGNIMHFKNACFIFVFISIVVRIL